MIGVAFGGQSRIRTYVTGLQVLLYFFQRDCCKRTESYTGNTERCSAEMSCSTAELSAQIQDAWNIDSLFIRKILLFICIQNDLLLASQGMSYMVPWCRTLAAYHVILWNLIAWRFLKIQDTGGFWFYFFSCKKYSFIFKKSLIAVCVPFFCVT